MPRKIIVCIDGTNNEIGDRATNVLKLYKSLDKTSQDVKYIMGVGTNDSTQIFGGLKQLFTGIPGQAFGYGLEDDVLDGYRFICEHFHHAGRDDRRASYEQQAIYIAGFSRGAYGARMLAGFIHNFGLVTPDKLHLIAPAFRAYRRVSDYDFGEAPGHVFRGLREYGHVLRPAPAPIRALLLFDTVNSMMRFRGLRRNIARHASLVDYGTHPSVNTNASVRIVVHALAIDEKRSMYRPQLWHDAGPGNRAYYGNRFKRGTAREQFVRQRWFPGYHSDIGGGVPEDESGIGKLTFLWMVRTLRELERAADDADRPDAEARHARALAKQGKSAEDHPLPTWSTARQGLQFEQPFLRNRIRGEPPGKKTPGGRAYAPPDPLAPIHNSHLPGPRNLVPLLWNLLEFFPKSISRRANGRPRWFRRGVLWYLPLYEPRRIPEGHEIDDSAYVRHYTVSECYTPPNLPYRPPRRS